MNSFKLPDLRPYQRRIWLAVMESLQVRQRCLVVSPTGTGKTVMMLRIAADTIAARGRVLMITPAHLVQQTVARARASGFVAFAEQGARRAEPWAELVVASIDTLATGRFRQWSPEHFALLLVDEAHHAIAKTWADTINHFEGAKVCGFTATPDRSDCEPLSAMFHDVAYEYTIMEAITEGWLCPVRQRFVQIEGLDYSRVRKDSRDMNTGDLDVILGNAAIVASMANETAGSCAGRQTVVFCVSVAHAHAFSEYLCEIGVRAAAVDGTMTPKARRRIEESFRAGETRVLTNVNCFSEGWDCPSVSAIVMARPTESRALYAQQIGRGLRPHKGKTDCLVLDFVGNSGTHTLVHAGGILDPEVSEEASAAIMRRHIERGGDGLITDTYEELDREGVIAALSGSVVAGDLLDVAEEIEVDPFSGTDADRVMQILNVNRRPDRWSRKATPKQLEALRRFGVEVDGSLGRVDASAMLDKLVERAKGRRATVRQVKALVRAGTTPENAARMSFEQAARGVEELAMNGWRRPESWGEPVKPGTDA